MVWVTLASSFAFSPSGTANGSSLTSFAQLSWRTSTGVSSRSFPGTDAEAFAVAAACRPALSAAWRVRSAVEKKPQPDPISARTPIPTEASCISSSTSPLRAPIDSLLRSMTRASAYRAPAAIAASTAASARSNIGEG
jgi:hypothetical protein